MKTQQIAQGMCAEETESGEKPELNITEMEEALVALRRYAHGSKNVCPPKVEK
jgi:hypothetical protein